MSCPAGGNACIVDVAAGGSATYDGDRRRSHRDGSDTRHGFCRPTMDLTLDGLRSNRTLQSNTRQRNRLMPGGWQRLLVRSRYRPTDRQPTCRPGVHPSSCRHTGTWTLPENHGLPAGRFHGAAGDSRTLHGNVVVSCLCGMGDACVNRRGMADGTATFTLGPAARPCVSLVNARRIDRDCPCSVQFMRPKPRSSIRSSSRTGTCTSGLTRRRRVNDLTSIQMHGGVAISVRTVARDGSGR